MVGKVGVRIKAKCDEVRTKETWQRKHNTPSIAAETVNYENMRSEQDNEGTVTVFIITLLCLILLTTERKKLENKSLIQSPITYK